MTLVGIYHFPRSCSATTCNTLFGTTTIHVLVNVRWGPNVLTESFCSYSTYSFAVTFEWVLSCIRLDMDMSSLSNVLVVNHFCLCLVNTRSSTWYFKQYGHITRRTSGRFIRSGCRPNDTVNEWNTFHLYPVYHGMATLDGSNGTSIHEISGWPTRWPMKWPVRCSAPRRCGFVALWPFRPFRFAA